MNLWDDLNMSLSLLMSEGEKMSKIQITHKKTLLRISVVLCVSLVVFSSLGSAMDFNSILVSNFSSKSSAILGSIVISSDSDFALHASEGDGTALNPYIIQDLTITLVELVM